MVKNTNDDGAGVLVSESGGYGLWVRSAADIGLVIDNAGRNGIYAFGGAAGAELHGQTGLVVGGIPVSDASVATDILLTGNSCFPCGPEDDDGVIRSDPSLSSSDIFMYSNDAFVVRLDTNGGDSGVFQVQNGNGAAVFQVSENGDVHVNGNIVHSSDRDVKASLGAVDAREVLDGLANLEISRWSFLADESGTPQRGPHGSGLQRRLRPRRGRPVHQRHRCRRRDYGRDQGPVRAGPGTAGAHRRPGGRGDGGKRGVSPRR